MITAKEAHEKSRLYNDEEVKKVLGIVGTEIDKVAGTGKFSARIDGHLSMDVKTALEGLGYQVSVGLPNEDSYYTVSWSHYR